MSDWDRVWTNINIATLSSTSAEPYGQIKDAALAVSGEQIAWLGPVSELPPAPMRK
jgi:imidazolonepropionase